MITLVMCILYLSQKHTGCNECSCQELKKSEIKMGSQGLCSVTADGNRILIITIQTAKHQVINLFMFCSQNCDY